MTVALTFRLLSSDSIPGSGGGSVFSVPSGGASHKPWGCLTSEKTCLSSKCRQGVRDIGCTVALTYSVVSSVVVEEVYSLFQVVAPPQTMGKPNI